KGGVVARRIAFGGVAQSRLAVVDPASLHGGCVEGVDLGATLGCKGRVLLHARRVKTVDPEHRVVDAVSDGVRSRVLRQLHDPAKAKRAQCCVIKGGGAANMRDADARMVDHGSTSDEIENESVTA